MGARVNGFVPVVEASLLTASGIAADAVRSAVVHPRLRTALPEPASSRPPHRPARAVLPKGGLGR